MVRATWNIGVSFSNPIGTISRPTISHVWSHTWDDAKPCVPPPLFLPLPRLLFFFFLFFGSPAPPPPPAAALVALVALAAADPPARAHFWRFSGFSHGGSLSNSNGSWYPSSSSSSPSSSSKSEL
eukprot:CAMPEP_0170173730 /NCGR_PEP_ID=MMETSP0040_2-20121228/7003_1 /TAXON_ID=641309 /ORGANISM="Lotharella oceanica, Strain CCMP622" /LENGTH=124 /DNA_ID=CAMNT_0010415053 /DNA_START=736 /DNA_END=1113 /DNA_ORIENTATION=-